MAYDDNAKRLAIQVIGTVESELNYGAINYGDPITVGIMQWYGVRAAAILGRMRTENPSTWNGVQAGIDIALKTVPADNPAWNETRLTREQGESLRPILQANRAIQDNQAIADMDVYRRVAEANGMNADTNTSSVIFFFTMYHQGPVYAFQVLNAVGPSASLEQFRDGALANPVLGQYSNRYNDAYRLIKAGPATDTPGGNPPPATETPDNGAEEMVKHVKAVTGQVLHVQLDNGTVVTCYPSTTGMWLPRQGVKPVTPVEPSPENPPVTPTGKWVHPLPQGTITSGYGPRDGGLHVALDISSVGGMSPGNLILACTDMKITVAREHGTGGLDDAGSYVKGQSLSGTPYTFSHFHGVAGSILVKPGQEVAAGTPLMREGATGNISGTHLHLEIWPGHLGPGSVSPIGDGPWYWGDGTPPDPLPILRANGVNI